MVLVLIIGDLHIPHRAHDLPAKFRKLLVPGKIQQILCTGNVCDRETYEYLRTIASDVCVVRGDYDESASFPPSATVVHAPIRIGIMHGHQCVPTGDLDALSALARQMDVDVLISGHTHTFQAIEYGGRFFVNPGSATGAWTGLRNSDPVPSFALMDIQGAVVVTYVYQLVEGEVRVDKIEYRKEVDASKPAAAPLTQSNSTYSSASSGFGQSAPTSPQATQGVW
ncbi:Metallo-dependent phosphatase [Gyrodon lividus]|nr:Metallo-dependent phosphatase [Gyrodon lividus]